MKKTWISLAAVLLLVLAAGFLIADRIIPKELSALLPEDYRPEKAYVHYYEWAESAELDSGEVENLLALLDSLEFRYNGRAFGTMYGEMYHVSFFQPVENGLVDLWVTKKRDIVYIDHKEYEMVGDSRLLLEFLKDLK